jgi:hypothetical protein
MAEGFCFVIFITYLSRPVILKRIRMMMAVEAMAIIMSVTTEELKLTNSSDMKVLNKRKQQQLSLGSCIFQCHAVIFYMKCNYWEIVS